MEPDATSCSSLSPVKVLSPQNLAGATLDSAVPWGRGGGRAQLSIFGAAFIARGQRMSSPQILKAFFGESSCVFSKLSM